jgi:hypothetical protein
MRASRSDWEIAFPLHEIESFARAEGYYRGLPAGLRGAQIDHMLRLHAQLYPALRVYLFDARRVFSAPMTVFGPLLAVIYLGSQHIAFRDRERVDGISRHFDLLVKEAAASAREFTGVLERLRGEVG